MSQGLLRRVFLPQKFTVRSDDTYIYYLCARMSFVVTTVLLFLNWISLIFQVDIDLFFFEINLPRKNFIEVFAYSFPFYTATSLFCFIIPFYLVKFFYNVNPKKVDVTWWYHNIRKETKQKTIQMIILYCLNGVIAIVGGYIAFGLPLFILSYSIFDSLKFSYFYLLLISLLFCVIYSIVSYLFLLSIIGLYRYIGPYSGGLSSHSIQRGVQKND